MTPSAARGLLVLLATSAGLVVMLPLFVLAAPLWFLSALTRVMARHLEPRIASPHDLIEFDPLVGWKPRSHLNAHHLALDVYRLRTDADGWCGNARLGDCEMVAVGDSFVVGYGVHARQSFANVRRTPRIKPIGAIGYSMVQELLWMKQLGDRLRGKHVVWFVYHGNDLYDNLMPELLGYRKPFVRESKHGGWEIVSSHVRADRWPITTEERLQGRNYFPRLAELCADTFLAKRAYSACEYLVAEGKQVCLQAGADLTILTIPDSTQLSPEGREHLRALGGHSSTFDLDRPDNNVDAACQRCGVRFLAGTSFLDAACYKIDDCHWNEEGHRRVAEMLAHLHQTGTTRLTGRLGDEGHKTAGQRPRRPRSFATMI